MQGRARALRVLLLAVSACSFPDVTFTSGIKADASVEGGSADGAFLEDGPAATDASVEPVDSGDASTDASEDVVSFDAATDVDVISDATADVVTADSGPDANPCDIDQDNFFAKGGACGGQDCDDLDSRKYPDAGGGAYFTFLSDAGDWNCDNAVDKQFATNVDCSAITILNGGSVTCNATSGFTNNPLCGATSVTFVQCSWSGLGPCVAGTASSQTQGCR